MSVLEKAVLHFEKKLPSTEIRFFVVTPEVVKDPKGSLKAILENLDAHKLVETYEKVFAKDKASTTRIILDKKEYYLEAYGPACTEERIDLIATWHLLSGMQLDSLFEEVVSMINEIREFESNFAQRKKVQIRFTEDAVDEILNQAVTQGRSATAICRRASEDYDYALKLIMDKTGQQEFVIPGEAIKDPESYINELIRTSYGTAPFAIRGPKDK